MNLKKSALLIFVATTALTVVSLLFFIQSKYFATILKSVAKKYMPSDFGVEGEFKELEVKFFPPGVVVKNPSVVLKDKNPAGLPAGTKLDAQFIDVTFQFFQLLTGTVTINAFAIHGADLKLDLDENFFLEYDKPKITKKRGALSWDSLVRFRFRSVSLIDSKLDLRISRAAGSTPITLQTFAKEFTIGRSTVDGLPAYDLAVDLNQTLLMSHAFSQLQLSVEVSSRGLKIRNLGLQDGELNAHANGTILGNILNPKGLKSDLNYILRGPIQKWLDPRFFGRFAKVPVPAKGKKLEGDISIEGSVSADLMDFLNTFETKASVEVEKVQYGNWLLDHGVVKGAWKSPKLDIESADLRIGEGRIRLGAVSYDVKATDPTVQTRIELEKVDFRRVMGSLLEKVYPLHMTLTGGIDLKGELSHSKSGIDDFEFEGASDLKVADFQLDNQSPKKAKPLNVVLAIPLIDLKTGFHFSPEGVVIEQAVAKLPKSQLVATGEISPERGLNLDIKGDVHLPDVRKLAKFDIAGDGKLHWTVKGQFPDIRFTFDADVKRARYLDLYLGDVKGRIVWEDMKDTLHLEDIFAQQGRSHFLANGAVNLGDSDTVDIKVNMSEGTVQDIAAVFADFIKRAAPWYPKEITGQAQGLIRITGKTDLNELVAIGDMKFSNVDYQHEIFRSINAKAGYRRGTYVAEDVFIQKKAGWLRGGITYGADDVIKYELSSDGLTTLDVDRFGILNIPYRAPLAIEARGSGKIGTLKSALHVALGQGSVKNYVVPPSDFTMDTSEGRLRANLSAWGGRGVARLDWGWNDGAASSIDAEAKSLDFLPILIALNPTLTEDPELYSEFSGSAHLKFRTGEISKLNGTIDFGSYSLRRKNYSLQLARPLHLDLRNGNYQFDGVQFVGNGTQILARGNVVDGRIHYDIDGSLNLGIFEFLVSEIESSRGSAVFKSQLFGRADGPNFKANVTVNESDLRLRRVEQPFENLKYRVTWNDSDLDFQDISAKFAGGQAYGSGHAEIFYYKVPNLDFQFTLDNPKVKVYPVTYARTSGKLAVKGEELPYKVKGSLYVAEALVRENFSLSEGSRILRSSKFLPQKGPGGVSELHFFDLDIDMSADRNIFVRNDLFDAELRGNLKVINTIQSPRLLGNVTILHGKLLFKDNFFAIQSGNLRFNNPAILDPEFDLSGQVEVKGYKVLLLAGGKVSDYNLTFQSQPILSQNDIVSLLTLGVTSSGYQSIAKENRGAYSRDEMYGLLFSQTGINKGLQEKLGVKVRVDQSQSLAPENVFRARNSTDVSETVSPKVVVQKEITKKLNASAGTTVGVGDSREQDVDVEYNFNRNFSVIGVYEDQRGVQPRDSRTSIGADLKFKVKFK